MTKQSGTGDSKSGKKGEFKSAAQKLLSVGGGNKSALSCAGATDNPGAAQLKNLTDVLNACEDNIHMACNSTNFEAVNVTKLEACKVVADDFKTGAAECLGKSVGADKTTTDDACACWTNATFDATVQAAKECKFADEAKAFAAALKTCKEAFSTCRKYEDEVSESISACKSNADDLKKEVAALSQNAEKVKEAQGVVKALAASRRMKRDDHAAASCTEVASIAVTLTTLVLEFPGAPDVLVLSATIIASSTVVCTDDEKTALAAVDEAFEDAVAHIDAGLEAAQSQLMTLTGATASPEEIAEVVAAETTAAAAETTAPAGAETTAPAGAETTAPAGAETTAPGATDTTAPGATDTTAPGATDTTAPGATDTTTAGATDTTTAGATDTTTAAPTTTTAAPTTTTTAAPTTTTP